MRNFLKGIIFISLLRYFWKKFWSIPIVDEVATEMLDELGRGLFADWDEKPAVKKHYDDIAKARKARQADKKEQTN